MNDSSEIATTHVLRALAYPIATWCTPHDGSHQNLSAGASFDVNAKYVLRSYGSFKIWKSLWDKPTQPKQYEQADRPTHRTR